MRTLTAAMGDRLGGSQYRRPVLLFAAVLALDSADKGTIGAVAPSVRAAFHVGNAEIGLLAALGSLVGAVATVPVGMLADRVRRVPLLAASTLVWSLAMMASGAAASFLMLVLAQLSLGAVTATAGPVLASLVGDVFPPQERGRIYGYIIAGELAGAGAGLVVSGNLSAVLSWRWAFWALAAAGLTLAYALRRFPEPRRGRPTQAAANAPATDDASARDDASASPSAGQRQGLASKTVQQAGVEPDPRLILTEDPARMPLRRAVSYVLRVPSNVVLIVASALGYYFFTGLRTFAVSFLHAHFGLGQAAASSLIILLGAGAFAGVLVGGRVGDGLLRRGKANGRVIAAIGTYFAATALLIPGIVTGALAAALPLYVAAAAFLAAANPPLDAARLDIMPAGLWGRAEAVRTVLRSGADASAPLLFGFAADRLAGGGSAGLEATFLIMLIPMVLGGVVGLRALRTYPRDVASAAASDAAIAHLGQAGPKPGPKARPGSPGGPAEDTPLWPRTHRRGRPVRSGAAR